MVHSDMFYFKSKLVPKFGDLVTIVNPHSFMTHYCNAANIKILRTIEANASHINKLIFKVILADSNNSSVDIILNNCGLKVYLVSPKVYLVSPITLKLVRREIIEQIEIMSI